MVGTWMDHGIGMDGLDVWMCTRFIYLHVTDGWMACARVLVVHRHSRALMCLCVALLGCVGRMLPWRATRTGATIRD